MIYFWVPLRALHSGSLVSLVFVFPDIGKFIIPIDELVFFREVGIPPTRIGLDNFGYV